MQEEQLDSRPGQARPCELCASMPEVIYGPDYRFGADKRDALRKVYTAQCGAPDCYTGVQFSSFTAARALEKWNQYEPPTARPAAG